MTELSGSKKIKYELKMNGWINLCIYSVTIVILSLHKDTVMGNGNSAVNKLKICSAFMEFTFQ